MKTKKIKKKLVLNKKVISNLNMSKVKGGEKNPYEDSVNYSCGLCTDDYDFD